MSFATAATAGSDRWAATLSYNRRGTVDDPQHSPVVALRLRVTHLGRAVDRTLPLPRECRRGGCLPAGFPGGPLFSIRILNPGAPPIGLVRLSTGGAHCCTILELVPLAGGPITSRNFGDYGAREERLAGRLVLISGDDRFAYLFTSYAASGLPLEIWRYDGGRLANVTRRFPARLARDADMWWKLVTRGRARRDEVRGHFAAWAADTCALGRRELLERELKAGLARRDFSPPRAEPTGPTGGAYATALRKRLLVWGYCR